MSRPSEHEWTSVALARQKAVSEVGRFRKASKQWEIEFDTPCSICASVLELLLEPIQYRVTTELGRLRSIVRRDCEVHTVIFPSNDALVDTHITIRKPNHQRLLYVYPDPSRDDACTVSQAPWELLKLDHGPRLFGSHDQPGNPRIVDESWIDIELLQGWYSECRDNHDDCRHDMAEANAMLVSPEPVSIGVLLVDTYNECLIAGSTSLHYAALSYIWGAANSFVTLKKRLKELKKPGALAQEPKAKFPLPKTIAQVMKLTKALGKRYLWVDAVCIVQDGDDKDDQLMNMASIYTGAALTIIAAEAEDANVGLRGLRGISAPRILKQSYAPINSEFALLRPGSKQVWDNSHQRTASRGWCYQEDLFSRRKLIFAANSVRWHCRSARWSEESDSPDCMATHGTADQQRVNQWSSERLLVSPLPTLAEYEALVNGFNGRMFTYPEDAYDAFVGISTRLSAKFQHGFCSGLPCLFFDLCLLWRPLLHAGPVRRRRAGKSESNWLLPSWSWLGWETEVVFPYTWSFSDDASGPVPAMVGVARPVSSVPIGVSNLLEDIPRRMPCFWQQYALDELDGKLSSGWARYDIHAYAEGRTVAHDFGASNDGDLHHYRHELDPSERFWFPVPIASSETVPTIAPYLALKSQTAKFKLGQVRGMITQIMTLDDQPAGTLWQHDEADSEFVKATSGAVAGRPSIDVVLVSDSFVPRDEAVVWDIEELLDDGHLNNRFRPRNVDHVCNVLWISRDGDITQRKASGVIAEKVWREAATVEETVTLS